MKFQAPNRRPRFPFFKLTVFLKRPDETPPIELVCPGNKSRVRVERECTATFSGTLKFYRPVRSVPDFQRERSEIAPNCKSTVSREFDRSSTSGVAGEQCLIRRGLAQIEAERRFGPALSLVEWLGSIIVDDCHRSLRSSRTRNELNITAWYFDRPDSSASGGVEFENLAIAFDQQVPGIGRKRE